MHQQYPRRIVCMSSTLTKFDQTHWRTTFYDWLLALNLRHWLRFGAYPNMSMTFCNTRNTPYTWEILLVRKLRPPPPPTQIQCMLLGRYVPKIVSESQVTYPPQVSQVAGCNFKDSLPGLNVEERWIFTPKTPKHPLYEQSHRDVSLSIPYHSQTSKKSWLKKQPTKSR